MERRPWGDTSCRQARPRPRAYRAVLLEMRERLTRRTRSPHRERRRPHGLGDEREQLAKISPRTLRAEDRSVCPASRRATAHRDRQSAGPGRGIALPCAAGMSAPSTADARRPAGSNHGPPRPQEHRSDRRSAIGTTATRRPFGRTLRWTRFMQRRLGDEPATFRDRSTNRLRSVAHVLARDGSELRVHSR